jgi:hypothetical protein
MISSSVFTGDAGETVIDSGWVAAQLARGVIDYGAGLLGLLVADWQRNKSVLYCSLCHQPS